MTILAAPQTSDTARGWETVADLRRVLAGLGADEALCRRVLLRTDMGDRQYVHVPPLPVDLVAHLARLLPVTAS